MSKLKVTDRNRYIIRDSIVDGVGLRSVVFVQGCNHNCKGCHNPSTHSFKKGVEIEVRDIVDEIDKDIINKAVTISGGDPMYQADSLLELVKRLKSKGYNIWVYTGFCLEELNGVQLEVLNYIDVLVDGRFEEEKKSMSLKFKGSSNQRLIDIQRYVNTGIIEELRF